MTTGRINQIANVNVALWDIKTKQGIIISTMSLDGLSIDKVCFIDEENLQVIDVKIALHIYEVYSTTATTQWRTLCV